MKDVLYVDITGNCSFSSINDKMMVKLEKANKNRKMRPIYFVATFY